jgi:arylamine N-acetyltransferase
MAMETGMLAADLVERVLERLDFRDRPAPTLENLATLYAAWCRRVPFDNVQKRVYMHEQRSGPLPGDEAADFFEDWLQHGTGGTCWAANGGLSALLGSLGYAVSRGVGSMLSSSNVPPNHGTVVVAFDGSRYMVDASILHSEPLRLDETEETRIVHPAWGVHCRRQDGRWHVRWRPLHTPSGIDCRIERLGASAETFREMHEVTRPWSPFNYELSVRLIRSDAVVGAAFGKRVTLDGAGSVVEALLQEHERVSLLVDVLGMSEEIALRLPPDTPTPPAPWARSPDDTWLGKRREAGPSRQRGRTGRE